MTDIKDVQRIVIGMATAALALAACTSAANSRQQVAAIRTAAPMSQPGRFAPCSVQTFIVRGVKYQVQFARNGAVQRYVISGNTQNEESNHDALESLQNRFGPEGLNAPPVRIIAFKTGYGGMKIPTKTIDSCDRITTMQ